MYLKDDKCCSQEAFSAFLEVFDDLFFFGSLRGRVTFKIVPSLVDRNLSAGKIACPVIRSDGNIERRCEIQIIPINEVNKLLSTLPHEICHAFPWYIHATQMVASSDLRTVARLVMELHGKK
jgi:hypothetical protein